jgi:hypothetical protein
MGEQDARLAVHPDQGHAEDRDDGAGGQHRGRPGLAGHHLEDRRESGLLVLELRQRLRGHRHEGHSQVERGDRYQGDDDRQR